MVRNVPLPVDNLGFRIKLWPSDHFGLLADVVCVPAHHSEPLHGNSFMRKLGTLFGKDGKETRIPAILITDIGDWIGN